MTNQYPQFFIATILEWKPLLKPNKYKQIIINSLAYLVQAQRVKVFAFVIMPNHIHLIWQMQESNQQFLQKLEYIHNNPLQPKRSLSNLPEAYTFFFRSFL